MKTTTTPISLNPPTPTNPHHTLNGNTIQQAQQNTHDPTKPTALHIQIQIQNTTIHTCYHQNQAYLITTTPKQTTHQLIPIPPNTDLHHITKNATQNWNP